MEDELEDHTWCCHELDVKRIKKKKHIKGWCYILTNVVTLTNVIDTVWTSQLGIA